MSDMNNVVSEEKLFEFMLDTDFYGAIDYFKTAPYETKRKLYFMLVDHITNMIAPKSEKVNSTSTYGPVDVGISNIVNAFGALNNDDKIEFLEYTIKDTVEAIDRYYDKYGVSFWRGSDQKIGLFTTLSVHNLPYEKDSVFYSKFLLALANSYFKYVNGNDASIDGLIDFSNIVQIDDCLETLGKLYASGVYKGEELGSDFFSKVFTALEKNLQEKTLNPCNVNSYLKLLKPVKDENGVWSRKKGDLIKKTNDILGALEIIGDEYRNDPEIVKAIEGRAKDLAEQLINKAGISFASDNLIEWVEILLKEVEKNEKTNLAQLRAIGGGAYSNVFALGEKVIKIGRQNKQFELPRNSRRFIQPIARMEVGGMHFEVTERVMPVKEEDVTEEELYNIYKELRDEDLYLVDFKANNFGRLIKPNEIYVDAIKETGGKPKRSYGPNIGIKKDEDVDVLGPGELVIVDLDYIYPYSYLEKDKKGLPVAGRMKEFSKRYESEKKKEKSAEIEEN